MKIVIPEPAAGGVEIPLRELDRAPERGGGSMRGPGGGKYHNRMALHHLAVETLTGDAVPFVAPCDLGKKDVTYSVVTAYLGVLPDDRCRFIRIRVEFRLGSSITKPPLRPRVCSMYPPQEAHEFKRVTSLEITAALDIKIDQVQLSGPTLAHKNEREAMVREYHVTTFGQCSSTPIWDVKATRNTPDLLGDFVFVLTTATPRGIATTGELFLEADVEAEGFRIPLISSEPTVAPVATRFELTRI